MHRLTVVIPVLNEAMRIAALLEALAPARAQGAEVLLVDGGSTDDTARIAAPWCDAVLTGAVGRGAQLAAGVAASHRPFVWLVHADSQLPAGAAQLVVAALARAPHVWGRFDIALTGADPRLRIIAALMNLRTRITGIVTGDHGVFVRRELLDAAGGIPVQPLMEDIELSKRLRGFAWPVALRARIVTSSRRWQERGVWRTVAAMWWLRLRYFVGAAPADLARAYYGKIAGRRSGAQGESQGESQRASQRESQGE